MRISSFILSFVLTFFIIEASYGQETFNFLRDRGPGMQTSLNATYLAEKEFLFYPFYEYNFVVNEEYIPMDLGYDVDQAYEAKSSSHEALLYLGYGISDWLIAEAEVAFINFTQQKSSSDNSTMPSPYKESGIENIDFQLRWRYWKETSKKPELFSNFVLAVPSAGSNKIIGLTGYDFKFASGLIKGFRFGTMIVSSSFQYNTYDSQFDFLGLDIEYVKRLNDKFRVYVGFDGLPIPDAFAVSTNLQIFPKPWMFIRLGNSFGIGSSGLIDFNQEIGVAIYFNKMRK
jgi:hypothetical protein